MSHNSLRVNTIKKDFPIFKTLPSLVYLDSSATSLKPRSVIEKLSEYYSSYSANIHRGIYKIAEKASAEYESARDVVAEFIHAYRREEVIFTKGTTEGINLVASTLGSSILQDGDEIVTTIMEHHANFVPWQQLAFRVSADLKVIHVNENYELPACRQARRITNDQSNTIDLTDVVTKKTKILAVTLVSNTLGTVNPVKAIIAAAKKINPGIITLVDAAQAVPHMKVDVQDLGCDFLVFSGHKMLGPTGIGVLWGKYDLLQKMEPYQYGGDMIREVTLAETTYADVPHRFEAGTPHIAGAIALKAAIAQLESYGLDAIHSHEIALATLARERLLKEFAGDIQLYGPSIAQSGIVTFTLKGIHPHDIAQILDEDDICVRAGHHCTMPLHDALAVPATTRASLYLYNTEEDVEKLVEGLQKARKILLKLI
ncbi:SufS family cysteine desulfurase [Candidatus Woesebacteria bacterium]|nr:SufS family cysteine desulfurase [Candidatus Woesebacteria bacterium]